MEALLVRRRSNSRSRHPVAYRSVCSRRPVSDVGIDPEIPHSARNDNAITNDLLLTSAVARAVDNSGRR
jgi:hypothetical protein